MSGEKSFSVCEEMLPLFRAVLKILTIFTQTCCNFGGIRYVSTVANVELTEMNNVFKFFGELINEKYIRPGGGAP